MDTIENALIRYWVEISIVISILLALYISMHIYKSIAKIMSMLQAINQGNPETESNNEIIYICDNIMDIYKNQQKIEDEFAKRLALLNKYKSIALQTQINPHFLFNTLQLVNLVIINTYKEDSDATRIISLLSDLLQISLDTKNHCIPLSEEIRHARKYLEIQNIKYEGIFKDIWDIEEGTESCLTIKLLLQPLIENSILHGLSHSKNGGNILIKSKIENEKLIISVSDNGSGFDTENLNFINAILGSENIQENRHIGLSNANQRIKLIFGNNYGLSITSIPNEMTTVTATMPVIYEI